MVRAVEGVGEVRRRRRIADLLHPEPIVGEPGDRAGRSLGLRRVRGPVLGTEATTGQVGFFRFQVPVTAMSQPRRAPGQP
ncbi:hypothetical protein ADK52_20270 [Streptomyces sp. WM6372]|nr:hypothetical protein ADK52_20270 [Streptomyces sp. WM6372]